MRHGRIVADFGEPMEVLYSITAVSLRPLRLLRVLTQ